MPPPSLSTTTMRRSAPRAGSAVSAPASWTKAMSPTSGDDGPAAEGDAERGRHDAVDAVGAPVGVGPGAGPAEPLEVAHRHRRGDDELGARRAGGGRSCASDRRLGQRRAARQSQRRSAASAVRAAARQRAAHGVPRGALPHLDERGEVVGAGARRPPVVGVDDARAADLHDGRPRAGDPLGEHLRRRRPPDAHDQLRRVVGGERVVAQQARRRT